MGKSGSPGPVGHRGSLLGPLGRHFTFAAGTYTFTAVDDDGVRLWVDGTPVIDQWQDQAESPPRRGTIALGAGTHEVKVEYYESTPGCGGRTSAGRPRPRPWTRRRCR